jgi:hypothetical protein
MYPLSAKTSREQVQQDARPKVVSTYSITSWAMATRRAQPGHSAQRLDCVAGVGGLELRNVDANYLFERSHRFAGIQPNSGCGDYSRLRCSAGDTQLGWVLPGSAASALHGRWPSFGVAGKAPSGRDLFRSEDEPPATKPATPLLSLRWTFRAKRACVVITDAEPDRLAPLAPPAPMGLRGVWVMAARCCASPAARCCADALERSFACPSANLRAPSKRGLHPRSVRRRSTTL